MSKKATTYLTQIYLMQVPLLSQRTNFDVTVLPIQKQSLINILRSAFQFFPTEKGKQRYAPSNFSCYRSNSTYKVLDRVFSLPTTGCPPPCHRCPPCPRTTSPLTSPLVYCGWCWDLSKKTEKLTPAPGPRPTNPTPKTLPPASAPHLLPAPQAPADRARPSSVPTPAPITRHPPPTSPGPSAPRSPFFLPGRPRPTATAAGPAAPSRYPPPDRPTAMTEARSPLRDDDHQTPPSAAPLSRRAARTCGGCWGAAPPARPRRRCRCHRAPRPHRASSCRPGHHRLRPLHLRAGGPPAASTPGCSASPSPLRRRRRLLLLLLLLMRPPGAERGRSGDGAVGGGGASATAGGGHCRRASAPARKEGAVRAHARQRLRSAHAPLGAGRWGRLSGGFWGGGGGGSPRFPRVP